MIDIATDETQPQAGAIHDLKTTLLEIVRDGVLERPDGVHLTHVGGQFSRRKGASFENYLNHLSITGELRLPATSRKMLPFLEDYCSDVFTIEDAGRGIYRVLPKKPVATPAPSLPNASAAAPALTPGEAPRFLKAVWVAFMRPLSLGRCRVLDIAGQNTIFADVPEGVAVSDPQNGRFIIPREYILGLDPSEPIDAAKLGANISRWASDSSLPVEKLLAPDQRRAVGRANVYDLIRIIDALPRELASRWLIPAEVFQTLHKS